MRMRAVVAAVAGTAAAATGHLLDVTGQLPFVHESADVRLGMPVAAVVVWLLGAAACAALAASTRAVAVGAPAAVLVSATPELWSRGDPGALLEPGALLGGLVQLLLVLLVVAVAVAFERIPAPTAARTAPQLWRSPPVEPPPAYTESLVGRDARPRAPPRSLCDTSVLFSQREETHVLRTRGAVARARDRTAPGRRSCCLQ